MRNARLTLAAFQIPDNLSFDQASTIPLGLATAAIGLYQKKKERGGLELVAPWVQGGRGKYAGQPIFITGGASSVGQYGTTLPFHARLDVEIYIFAESSPASKAQWVRPNCHNSLCIQRELLSSCRRNSRYRLPHHPIRFDSRRDQRDNEGTCWYCLRCHFVTRDTESKLGDPAAKWEPCRDTPIDNRHICRAE
jgi:hypothetical protein